jgi:hypothetical protein
VVSHDKNERFLFLLAVNIASAYVPTLVWMFFLYPWPDTAYEWVRTWVQSPISFFAYLLWLVLMGDPAIIWWGMYLVFLALVVLLSATECRFRSARLVALLPAASFVCWVFCVLWCTPESVPINGWHLLILFFVLASILVVGMLCLRSTKMVIASVALSLGSYSLFQGLAFVMFTHRMAFH